MRSLMKVQEAEERATEYRFGLLCSTIFNCAGMVGEDEKPVHRQPSDFFPSLPAYKEAHDSRYMSMEATAAMLSRLAGGTRPPKP